MLPFHVREYNLFLLPTQTRTAQKKTRDPPTCSCQGFQVKLVCDE